MEKGFYRQLFKGKFYSLRPFKSGDNIVIFIKHNKV